MSDRPTCTQSTSGLPSAGKSQVLVPDINEAFFDG